MKQLKLAICFLISFSGVPVSSYAFNLDSTQCPSASDLKLANLQYVLPDDWAPEYWTAAGQLNLNGKTWDINVFYLTEKKDIDAFNQGKLALTSVTPTPPLQERYDEDITCSYHTTLDPHMYITADYDSSRY